MRPPSSIEPFTPSAAITLHPTLQAVLDNLDVQIEAELSRYRRQRRNPNAAPRRRSIAAQSPAASILKQSIQLPQPQSSIYAQPACAQPAYEPYDVPVARSQATPPVPQIAQSLPIQSWVAPLPAPQPVRLPAPLAPAPEALPSAPTSDAWAAHSPAAAPAPAPAAPDSAAIASYAEQYDLSAYAPGSVLQRLMQQLEPPVSASYSSVQAPEADPASSTEDPEAYADYLASSEELLRSIAEESSTRQAEPNALLDTLLTPLGIGSMLLLLLSSTTLGYVMMNPSSVGLNMAQPQLSASQTAPFGIQTADAPVKAGAAGQEAMPSPNLAAEEFLELGLDTLSSIPKPGLSKPVSKPTAKPDPADPSKPSASQPIRHSDSRSDAPADAAPKTRSSEQPALTELPAAPVVEPSLATVVVPAQPRIVEPAEPAYSAPPAPVISPEPISIAPPSAVEPAPATTAAPAAANVASQGRYYVVTEYTGDPSLRAARGAVPDAYVRNIPSEGAKVQLGAFSDAARAAELQQDLQRQGIQAEVYRP